jgi:type II secretory pathway component PulF
MPTFAYTALDTSGQQATGVVTAASRSVAIDQVESQGLYPLQVEERQPRAPRTLNPLARSGRVSPRQVEAFTRELSNLLGAGVSLGRALQLLAQEASTPAARRLWSEINDDVLNGTSLADALHKWPGAFSDVNVAMVRAGETGGFLDVVLNHIADLRARERDLLGKVKAALIYPVILSTLMVAVLIFLLTYFIPKFKLMFDDFGEALPALTQVIVGLSKVIVGYGVFIAVGVALLVILVRRAMATDGGKRLVERLLLETPGLGPVLARFALVRFCRMLGTLIAAGVPLVAALKVAREAIGNQTLSDAVTAATEQVQAGEPLARSLAQCPILFPAAVIEMIAVAEESGRLDQELVRQAGAYEGDLDRRLRMLVAVVEPALLFIMAAVVGTIVVGMLLPIFTLQDLIG